MFKKRQKRGAFDASDVIREKHRSTRVFCDVVPLSHPLSLSLGATVVLYILDLCFLCHATLVVG